MADLPILRLADVELTFGGTPIFTGVTFTLARGERAALVGRNGAGKSTLMKLVTGTHAPDAGDLWRQPGVEVATVEQEPDLSAFATVLDYAAENLEAIWMAEAELGLFGIDPEADPKTLSGGQIRRAALARAFARDPDILLLDEPTNHLDVPMIETLETRLKSFSGAVLLVSHDRRFLENVTTTTLWLRQGKVWKSPKGYAEFDEWAAGIEAEEEKQLQRMKTHLKEEQHWLARGVTARRKRNMGRLTRLHELRAQHAKQKSLVNDAKSTAGLSAESGDSQSRKVLEAFGISKSFDDTVIAKDLSLRILKGDRIGIVGPNGVGKTTLLKILLGELAPDTGSVKIGQTLNVTYLDQTRDTLKPDETLWEALTPAGGDSIIVQGQPKHIAGYAKDFLFSPEQLRQPVSALSGGERNRLTMAIALAQPADVLVLDEPTNDLDMQTLDLLEEMLSDYDGTLILVSHDRAFLDAIVTSCLVPLGGGRWVETSGGWSDAARQVPSLSTRTAAKPADKAQKKQANAQASGGSKREAKLSFKDKHRLKEAEAAMPRLSAEIEKLESELSDPELFNKDPGRFQKVSDRLAAARSELEEAEMVWLEIEAMKEELEKASGA
ncbi:ABC-F family ATP-binding cassette domain-containing protein [Henriciella algicola]|uniref:ABC transporter ATP-binding protein n=1 Tax=Henriciella algicola TaxID=1608422 RepID=A0A399RNE4_9PROT|nr:ABC-F family ATP-binding cassette domain-containing protein [Henriciella algicola]RIJ31175.1 ABC transporter ATP-binding protein [Henriciella algicola]